jgi:NAD(P)-dependent dehydrogenase (short-subunit alcohol dehydrogenase family)
MRLKDKTAVITGGSGEIGLAVGKLFSREGAKVMLVDLNEDKLKEAVQSIASDSAEYAVADVTRPEEVQKYVQKAVELYGRVDVFVNNAGVEGAVKPIHDYPVDIFDKVMAVNVRGVWLGLKYMIPEMLKFGQGSIIITSSIAGIKGSPLVSAYIASKHADVGLMRTAALELAETGIRVNSVNPAPIESAMMRRLERGLMPDALEEAKVMFQQMMPKKLYGQPEDVANVMLFLASDESRYCTGGVYVVDGGASAH